MKEHQKFSICITIVATLFYTVTVHISNSDACGGGSGSKKSKINNDTGAITNVVEWDTFNITGDNVVAEFFTVMENVTNHRNKKILGPQYTGEGGGPQSGYGPWTKPGWGYKGWPPESLPGQNGRPGGGEEDDPKLKGIVNFQTKYGPGENGVPPPDWAFYNAMDLGKPYFCNDVDNQTDCTIKPESRWRYQPKTDECELFTYCGVGYNQFTTQERCEQVCLGSYEGGCDPRHYIVLDDVFGIP